MPRFLSSLLRSSAICLLLTPSLLAQDLELQGARRLLGEGNFESAAKAYRSIRRRLVSKD